MIIELKWESKYYVLICTPITPCIYTCNKKNLQFQWNSIILTILLKCPVWVHACFSNNVETKRREVTVMLSGTVKTNRKVGVKNRKTWKSCFWVQRACWGKGREEEDDISPTICVWFNKILEYIITVAFNDNSIVSFYLVIGLRCKL